jgi:hypothetical protein
MKVLHTFKPWQNVNQTKKGLNITQIVVTLTLSSRPSLGHDKKEGQEQN